MAEVARTRPPLLFPRSRSGGLLRRPPLERVLVALGRPFEGFQPLGGGTVDDAVQHGASMDVEADALGVLSSGLVKGHTDGTACSSMDIL